MFLLKVPHKEAQAVEVQVVTAQTVVTVLTATEHAQQAKDSVFAMKGILTLIAAKKSLNLKME